MLALVNKIILGWETLVSLLVIIFWFVVVAVVVATVKAEEKRRRLLGMAHRKGGYGHE